jgi:hypothetical protein
VSEPTEAERLFVVVDRSDGKPLRIRDRNNRALEGLLVASTAAAVDAALVKMFGEGDWLRRGPRFEIREQSVSGAVIDVTVPNTERWRLAGTPAS